MTEIDNILTIKQSIATRFRNLRRSLKLTQSDVAERSGVSLGSVKRFERTGNISLAALLQLAQVVGKETDFNDLFAGRTYRSIFDVVKDGENAK